MVCILFILYSTLFFSNEPQYSYFTSDCFLQSDTIKIPPPPPPPPPPPLLLESDLEKIYRNYGNLNHFPVCNNPEENFSRKLECIRQNLIDFIESKLEYPKEALENNISGICIIQFVLDKDGSIKNPRILRDIDYGCGQEVLRIVNNSEQLILTNRTAKGRRIKLLLTLPIEFCLPE